MSAVTDLQVGVGVLALQGGYAAHQASLRAMGVEARAITTPNQLAGLQGLILPGGESTTMLHLQQSSAFFEAIKVWYWQGGALFGTCAGAILLASRVEPEQPMGLRLMDMSIVRNAYGRQLSSHVAQGRYVLDGRGCECVFIRAPKIEVTSASVIVEYGGWPVCVQQERCLAATFHPELTDDKSLYRHFLTMCAQ